MKKVDITYMLSTFDCHKEFKFFFKPQVGSTIELKWNGLTWNQENNNVDVIMTEMERKYVKL